MFAMSWLAPHSTLAQKAQLLVGGDRAETRCVPENIFLLRLVRGCVLRAMVAARARKSGTARPGVCCRGPCALALGSRLIAGIAPVWLSEWFPALGSDPISAGPSWLPGRRVSRSSSSATCALRAP